VAKPSGRVGRLKSFAHTPDGLNELRRLTLIYVQLLANILLSAAKNLLARASPAEAIDQKSSRTVDWNADICTDS
jgi:hypothetical protein